MLCMFGVLFKKFNATSEVHYGFSYQEPTSFLNALGPPKACKRVLFIIFILEKGNFNDFDNSELLFCYQQVEEKERKAQEKKDKRVLDNWRKLTKGLIMYHKIKKKYAKQPVPANETSTSAASSQNNE